jgi:hypothetical protein
MPKCQIFFNAGLAIENFLDFISFSWAMNFGA